MAVAGRIAFVTGAGSGIGRATCCVLAREGAKVVAADKNHKAAMETSKLLCSDSHLSIGVDVSQGASVEAAVQEALRRYSCPPSIVVNCAGITRDNFLLKMEDDEFQEVVDVNLRGTFLVMRAAARAMVDAGVREGSIVNVASIVGKTGNLGQGNYSASKAAVEALTRTAAMEFGKFGIRCNSVLPGFIISPMTDKIPDKVKSMFVPRISVGRFGTPEEVAEVITFLASGKSSYVNCASIEITGGFF